MEYVEVMDDEFNFDFELVNKSAINSAKSYKLVVQLYQPKLLRITQSTKDIEIKF